MTYLIYIIPTTWELFTILWHDLIHSDISIYQYQDISGLFIWDKSFGASPNIKLPRRCGQLLGHRCGVACVMIESRINGACGWLINVDLSIPGDHSLWITMNHSDIFIQNHLVYHTTSIHFLHTRPSPGYPKRVAPLWEPSVENGSVDGWRCFPLIMCGNPSIFVCTYISIFYDYVWYTSIDVCTYTHTFIILCWIYQIFLAFSFLWFWWPWSNFGPIA